MPLDTQLLVQEIKQENQDFEWYPTTKEIINSVANHIKGLEGRGCGSLLDIGAGDGRVLMSLKENEALDINSVYAIEKAEPLISAMNEEIVIVGTELFEQQLLDKDVDIIFCNPPYSEYELWVEKIITEAYATAIYLVIPQRWKNNKNTLDLIEKRGFKYEIINSFDFENADRKARAKVDLICIKTKTHYNKPDPFDLFIEEHFDNFQKKDYNDNIKEDFQAEIKKEVVTGKSLIQALEELYLREMKVLHDNFNAVRLLDPDIFKALDVNLDNVKEALRSKTVGLKNKYWQELFNNLDVLTDRLCSKQRDDMYNKLRRHNTLDFTSKNAYAVVIWVIKNANKFYDEQLIEAFKSLLDPENVSNYKSNKVLTGKKEYRYNKYAYRNDVENVSLKLDYRLVHQCGDTFGDNSYSWGLTNGLKDRALRFIEDIFTVGKNLGFDIIDSPKTCRAWEAGEIREFAMRDGKGGTEIFASIRAYKNGNLHFKLHQDFLKKWNVEAGRLLGWLKNAEQAKEETGIKESSIHWMNNYQSNKNSLGGALMISGF